LVVSLTGAGDNDGNDEAVDTKDTSHDHGDDRLNNQLGLEDSDGADTDTRLGSAVSCSHVAENKCRNDAHAAEEERLVGISVN